jgi:alpha-beta hydrolase superfamily lysophospholipase
MRVELVHARANSSARGRIVVLPGAYHEPADVLRAGFANAIQARGLAMDLALVDMTLAHVTDRSVLADLHRQVVAPARAAGCERIWIAGISLGGMMALLYAARYPAELDGLCLLAPYLGNRMIVTEISRYASLADWNAGAGGTGRDELAEERVLWRFIAHQSLLDPKWYLGFGREDRFVTAHRLLAKQLPFSAVDEIAGGHDWPVWCQLWDRFLMRLELPG